VAGLVGCGMVITCHHVNVGILRRLELREHFYQRRGRQGGGGYDTESWTDVSRMVVNGKGEGWRGG